MLEVGKVTLYTKAFTHLTYNGAEIKGHRILSLPYVDSIDWIHGVIEVICDSIEELPGIMTDLEKHLVARRAKGERVQEIFHEWGQTVYTYKYHPGKYPIEVVD